VTKISSSVNFAVFVAWICRQAGSSISKDDKSAFGTNIRGGKGRCSVINALVNIGMSPLQMALPPKTDVSPAAAQREG